MKEETSIKEFAKKFLATSQGADEFDDMAKLLWEALSNGAKDNLVALVKAGPLWDGDVPSKSGRDELLDLGLISKAVVKGKQGYQVANYSGWSVYKAGLVL